MQSFSWVDVTDALQFGSAAWYSKVVRAWPNGYVESLAVAQDSTISSKRKALAEVIYYIHQAGEDIELARHGGGEAMSEIA